MAGLKKKQIKEKKQKEQTGKENRMAKSLLLLNPGNLAKEVYTYGYHFSWKTHLFVIGACIAGMGAIGLLFQLKWELLVIVLIAMFLALPAFILDTYKKMYEQKRFADAATYMEQMLYAFQKTGKVLSALKETRETFEPGHMRDIVDEAVRHLEDGRSYSEKGALRESLDIVEKEYECRKIKTLHELLASTEKYGGDADDSITLLLDDVELWKRRGYVLQKEKKEAHTNNVVSIIVATALCAGTLYVLNALPDMMGMQAPYNVLTTGLIQITSFGLLLWMIYVYARSEKTLTRNWLKEDSGRDEGYVLRCYEEVKNYDGKKEMKKIPLDEMYYIAGINAYTGNIVQKDNSVAVRWWELATEAGNIKAKTMLGISYYTGRGIGQNYTKAVELLKEAALSGNTLAEFTLAKAYLAGNGVQYNRAVALELLRDAQNRGMKEAGNLADNLEGR